LARGEAFSVAPLVSHSNSAHERIVAYGRASPVDPARLTKLSRRIARNHYLKLVSGVRNISAPSY
jgi:hypothetical protein